MNMKAFDNTGQKDREGAHVWELLRCGDRTTIPTHLTEVPPGKGVGGNAQRNTKFCVQIGTDLKTLKNTLQLDTNRRSYRTPKLRKFHKPSKDKTGYLRQRNMTQQISLDKNKTVYSKLRKNDYKLQYQSTKRKKKRTLPDIQGLRITTLKSYLEEPVM